MTSHRALVAVFLAATVAACHADRRPEVEKAVRVYLDKLVEAYRVSDASLMDPLVSEHQGLKLTGLIGVKRDSDLVLDAKLLELTFTRVERQRDVWIAETRERWYYRDRRIGSGEQVGDDSTDSYALRYTFSRKSGSWILEKLEFIEAPAVGRKSAPVTTDLRQLHGLKPDPGEAGAHAGPRPDERRSARP